MAWKLRGGAASAAGRPQVPHLVQMLLKPETGLSLSPSPPPEPGEAFADLEEVKRERERVGTFRRTNTDRWVVEQMDRDTHAQTN